MSYGSSRESIRSSQPARSRGIEGRPRQSERPWRHQSAASAVAWSPCSGWRRSWRCCPRPGGFRWPRCCCWWWCWPAWLWPVWVERPTPRLVVPMRRAWSLGHCAWPFWVLSRWWVRGGLGCWAWFLSQAGRSSRRAAAALRNWHASQLRRGSWTRAFMGRAQAALLIGWVMSLLARSPTWEQVKPHFNTPRLHLQHGTLALRNALLEVIQAWMGQTVICGTLGIPRR